ncbi:hypothetical protein BJY04DRAFT_223488 [Aspergillus karnatakaensis]|uniref:uncharacterized protein n=1 Tax=Aspergillus karnatakaensis TaxID=1810916 RepID=UPI003CCD25D5
MNPVTEICFFTFIPTADLKKVAAGVDAIPSRPPGIRTGKVTHDVLFLLDWDDIRCHEQFTRSGADYEAVGDILTPALAAPPVVFHASLDQEILAAVMDAPVVELVTFYHVSDVFQDILRRELSSKFDLFVDAPVVEALAQQPGGAEGPAHFPAIAVTGESGVERSQEYTFPGCEGVERRYVRYLA